MPCDLVITRIGLPPRLVAPCRIRVEVDVTNAGADRAALPFDVLLTFPSGADETGRGPRYVETVKGGEGNWLMPGQTVIVPFMVSLPCRVQTQVRATADPSMVVPDNEPGLSRITMVARCGPALAKQIIGQLHKQIDVISVEMTDKEISWPTSTINKTQIQA